MTPRSVSKNKSTSRRRLLSFLGGILIPAGFVYAVGSRTNEEEKVTIDTGKAEKLTIEEVNERRQDHSLAILEEHTPLTKAARRHSKDMAKRDFFSHKNPDGEMPSDRVEDDELIVGENIVKPSIDTNLTDDMPVDRIDSEEDLALTSAVSWMKSKGHRENIINENFRLTGVGIHVDENDWAYVTQLYGFY